MSIIRDLAAVVTIASVIVTLGAWIRFVVQCVRLPWHVRWDIKPYPSTSQLQWGAFQHPEWLDEKGIAIRRGARRSLVVAVVGLAVLFATIFVRAYVDV
jgi:hypothetical protein